MPMHRTQKQSDKVIGNEKFTPIDAFPLEKLPTLENVIDRCLIKRNGKKNITVMLTIFLKKRSFCLMFSKRTKTCDQRWKKILLVLAEADYQYYEDQRTTRNGFCTLDAVPSTSTDIRFQSRIIQVKKAKSNYEAEKYAPGT